MSNDARDFYEIYKENESLRAEVQEQARLLGISGSKEVRLLAENERYRSFIQRVAEEAHSYWKKQAKQALAQGEEGK